MQKTLHATHLLKLLDKMHKYQMDPTRTVGPTERTRDAGQMNGRTDGQSETNISPQQLCCIMMTDYWQPSQEVLCILPGNPQGSVGDEAGRLSWNPCDAPAVSFPSHRWNAAQFWRCCETRRRSDACQGHRELCGIVLQMPTKWSIKTVKFTLRETVNSSQRLGNGAKKPSTLYVLNFSEGK